LGHASIIKLIQNLEDRVNAAKSCSEIVQTIKIFWKKAVHPNHFLMFRLWDKFYFTSHKEGANDEASLRQRICAGEHLIWILGKLDPGLSKRTETVLKILRADKMALSKLQPGREITGDSPQGDESSAIDPSSMGGSHAR